MGVVFPSAGHVGPCFDEVVEGGGTVAFSQCDRDRHGSLRLGVESGAQLDGLFGCDVESVGEGRNPCRVGTGLDGAVHEFEVVVAVAV